VDTLELARQEREDLVALLETLTPEEWEAETLCTRWRVRDVVAHVIGYDALPFARLAALYVRGGFGVNRVNALEVATLADRTPAQLLDLVRAHVRPTGLTAGFGGRIALTDGLIHQQDIRRSLGRPRQIPAERLVRALTFGRLAPPVGAVRRARGLRLVATDIDWSAGRGPELRGPAEALLMAIAGRPAALAELTGPAQPILASRVIGHG
jgi:uncharacterized protein (TIGR03083 family)